VVGERRNGNGEKGGTAHLAETRFGFLPLPAASLPTTPRTPKNKGARI
jgi:hypothetical protein